MDDAVVMSHRAVEERWIDDDVGIQYLYRARMAT